MLIMTMITVKKTKLNDRSSYRMRILQKNVNVHTRMQKSSWLKRERLSSHSLVRGQKSLEPEQSRYGLSIRGAVDRFDFSSKTRSIFARPMESNKTRKK